MGTATNEGSSAGVIILFGVVLVLAFALAAQLAAPCAAYRIRVALFEEGFSWTTTSCTMWPGAGCVCQTYTRPDWVMIREGGEPEPMPPRREEIKVEVVF